MHGSPLENGLLEKHVSLTRGLFWAVEDGKEPDL